MKLAEFNDLCRREYERDRGVVTSLSLSPEECAELSAEVFSAGPTGGGIMYVLPRAGAESDRVAGRALVTRIVNPAAGDDGLPVTVIVSVLWGVGALPGAAEVMRRVPIREGAA